MNKKKKETKRPVVDYDGDAHDFTPSWITCIICPPTLDEHM